MSAPPVSIGLPVRNGERFLSQAIADLLGQTFTDFELLIADNASDDLTEEIARAATSDSRVRYVRHAQNIGAAANYNFVFHETNGAHFRWASHDDRCRPSHLERCLEAFHDDGADHDADGGADDVVLVYPRTILIDEHGDEIGPYEDRLAMPQPLALDRLVTLSRNWRLCNPVMGLMRRDAAARTRLIDTFRSSDLVFLAELAILGRVVEVPESLFLRRIHGGSAMQGGSTDAVSWLDPNSTRRSGPSTSTLPVLREVLRSVQHLGPSDARERTRIQLAVSSAWVTRRTRVQAGLLKRRAASLRSPSAA